MERVEAAWAVLTDTMSRHCLGRAQGHRDRLPWARAIEGHRDGEFHIHALFAAPVGAKRRLIPGIVLDYWVGMTRANPHIGLAKVEPFDPSRTSAALRYLTKTADRGGDIMASPALRDGVQAPSDSGLAGRGSKRPARGSRR